MLPSAHTACSKPTRTREAEREKHGKRKDPGVCARARSSTREAEESGVGAEAYLLTDVVVGGAEQLDEDGHGALADDHLGVLRRARRDVGQGPRRLELQAGVVGPLHHVMTRQRRGGRGEKCDDNTSDLEEARG